MRYILSAISSVMPLPILLNIAVCTLATGSARDAGMKFMVIFEKLFEDSCEDLKFALAEQNFCRWSATNMTPINGFVGRRLKRS